MLANILGSDTLIVLHVSPSLYCRREPVSRNSPGASTAFMSSAKPNTKQTPMNLGLRQPCQRWRRHLPSP